MKRFLFLALAVVLEFAGLADAGPARSRPAAGGRSAVRGPVAGVRTTPVRTVRVRVRSLTYGGGYGTFGGRFYGTGYATSYGAGFAPPVLVDVPPVLLDAPALSYGSGYAAGGCQSYGAGYAGYGANFYRSTFYRGGFYGGGFRRR